MHVGRSAQQEVEQLERVSNGPIISATALQPPIQAKLSFHGQLSDLNNKAQLKQHLASARKQDWVVYAKAPFGGPEKAIDYLGRYTHKVAITNHRLISDCEGQITFRYKDYGSADPQTQRTMTLNADEFIRRFLLHAIPPGFQRIRHYGLYANRNREAKLEICRKLRQAPQPSPLASPGAKTSDQIETAASCPVCKLGMMLREMRLPPIRWPARPP